mmetsp:Transcript_21610/g.32713  ORF Transcript_21610/g.32713 Transcript_21610/m.32713 type:complete len:204 (+) Transcript_21610:2395-3006(+)
MRQAQLQVLNHLTTHRSILQTFQAQSQPVRLPEIQVHRFPRCRLCHHQRTPLVLHRFFQHHCLLQFHYCNRLLPRLRFRHWNHRIIRLLTPRIHQLHIHPCCLLVVHLVLRPMCRREAHHPNQRPVLQAFHHTSHLIVHQVCHPNYLRIHRLESLHRHRQMHHQSRPHLFHLASHHSNPKGRLECHHQDHPICHPQFLPIRRL